MPSSPSSTFYILFVIALLLLCHGIHSQSADQSNEGSDGGGNLSIGTLLDTLTDKGREDLATILANVDNKTKQETTNGLDQWAQAQGQDFNTLYLGLKKAYEDARTELDVKHAALMANQTADVQAGDKTIRAIANNQFITPLQEKAQIMTEMAKLSPEVQAKITELAPYPY